MDCFWDEFSKSTIVSGALALTIWGVICYLAVTAQPVPEIMYFGGAAIIGYFFGAKNKQETERIRARLEKEDEKGG